MGVKSIYKHCGSIVESNLDTAIGVQPAKRGEHSALSDPVLVIGSIILMGPGRQETESVDTFRKKSLTSDS